jgi:hypothetical protein
MLPKYFIVTVSYVPKRNCQVSNIRRAFCPANSKEGNAKTAQLQVTTSRLNETLE